jgi:hypothetical protein
MSIFRSLLVASLLVFGANAGVDEWLSPVYKDFYKYPLPIPQNKARKSYVDTL